MLYLERDPGRDELLLTELWVCRPDQLMINMTPTFDLDAVLQNQGNQGKGDSVGANGSRNDARYQKSGLCQASPHHLHYHSQTTSDAG